MSVVDAHHHLWDLERRPSPWLDAPALAPIRRSYGRGDLRRHVEAAGVERTILVQTIPEIAETRDFLLQAQESEGLIAGVVGWVDLTDPAIDHTLEELRAGPGGERLVGVRHQVQDEPDPRWLLRDEVVRGLQAIAAAGLVFDLLVLAPQLPQAIEAVTRVPQGRFVLDHGGKPPVRAREREPWASRLEELADQPHVACKLSGLVTEADWDAWGVEDLRPYAHVMFEAFGPARVMVGSDWPVCELAGTYEEVWDAITSLVPPADRDAVLGAVAERWYRL